MPIEKRQGVWSKAKKKEVCEMENSEVLREDIRRKSQKSKVESEKWKMEKGNVQSLVALSEKWKVKSYKW